jgi:bifunctional UDP-N-acetylglucosamine pyrophosphorylase/glucosamine-1-phosphate N-acetyltransferase
MGEDVFIGSNNSLVAPVEIQAGATTAPARPSPRW